MDYTEKGVKAIEAAISHLWYDLANSNSVQSTKDIQEIIDGLYTAKVYMEMNE